MQLIKIIKMPLSQNIRRQTTNDRQQQQLLLRLLLLLLLLLLEQPMAKWYGTWQVEWDAP